MGFIRTVRNSAAQVRCIVRLPSGDTIQDFECTGLDVHRGFQRHRKLLHGAVGFQPDHALKTKFWPLAFKLVLDISSSRSVATSGDLAAAEAATCFLIECGFTRFHDRDVLQVVAARNSEVNVVLSPHIGSSRQPDAVLLGNYAAKLRTFQQLLGAP